ncbi:alkaline phosphatase [Paenibacillus terrigena]|uniref:alkaline phosphatase family protein n=1 Tax=Paenibacillus terrigena TaxID=369333 RepID=UPI0028D5FDCB|nr:alkaline phosphatase [Paenibacillus terrigena]
MGDICKHVFVIGLDGAGNFIKDTPTPNIHGLLQQGALTYQAQTVFPSISAQCWGSMFHGVEPDQHQLSNDIASDTRFPEDSVYPSFMKLIRQQYPDAKLAAFSEWSPINHGIIEQSCQFENLSIRCPELITTAADYIRNNPDVKCLYVQIDNPDGAGHEFGYGNHVPKYLAKITEVDEYVGVLLDAIRDAGILEESLIIITSDHGGGGDHPRSHGSDHPMDMTIFWGCYGKAVASGVEITDAVSIKDTAHVVAYALGIEPCPTWSGKVPEGIFTTAVVAE